MNEATNIHVQIPVHQQMVMCKYLYIFSAVQQRVVLARKSNALDTDEFSFEMFNWRKVQRNAWIWNL